MTEPAGPEELMPFDLWWSPSIGVWRHTPRGPMLTPGFEMVNDSDGEHFREEMPDDAVRLVLADPEQGSELVAQRELNGKLMIALDAARIPHQAAYVDPEHRGGNCIDVIMELSAEAHKLASENVDMQVRISAQQARIDKAMALAEQHVTFGPVPSPAANVCRQVRAALAPVLPGDETPQPEEDQ